MKKSFLWGGLGIVILVVGLFAGEQYLKIARQKDVLEATQMLENIPELKHIEQITRAAGQEPFLWPENDNQGIVTISLYESFKSDAHTHRMVTFKVNVRSKEIVVVDEISSKDMSLSDWKDQVNLNWP